MSGILDAGTVAEFRAMAEAGRVDTATPIVQTQSEPSPGVFSVVPALGIAVPVRVHSLGVPTPLDAGQLQAAVRVEVSFAPGTVLAIGAQYRLGVRQADDSILETDVEVVALDEPNTDPIKTLAHCKTIPRVEIE